jgi:hypothetical protein
VKLAECSGIWVPDELEARVPGYADKHELLKKLAGLEQEYQRLATSDRRQSHWDRFLWDLRKAAAWDLSDAQIDSLRDGDPNRVFETFARRGIVMSAPTFFKFALGADYGELAPQMGAILADVGDSMYTRLHKEGAYQRVCRNSYFDVDTEQVTGYGVWQHDGLSKIAAAEIAELGAFVGSTLDSRIIEATICDRQPEVAVIQKSAAVGSHMHRGAEIYAAYKLSALNAICSCNKQANADTLLALAAVQNMMR